MIRYRMSIFALALATSFPSICNAQSLSDPIIGSYADLADMALQAPVVIDATIRSATRMKDAISPPPTPGFARYLIEADVVALIRGAGGSAPRVRYVANVRLDSRGKAPKLKKNRVLILARPVPGKPADLQLASPDAQLTWNAETEATLRSILTEAVSPEAPPRIARVGNAFHVPGAIRGESETQIFLITDSGEPVSLSIIRRPGQGPRWAVALGEIVDESAATPKPQSLLWYRLACFLPRALPAGAMDESDPVALNQAQADYRVVIEGLGICTRNRPAALQPASLPR